jgi:hypothetical protein
MKWILGSVGLTLLGISAVRAAASGGQSGVVVMAAAGSVLILSPFVIDRLESVSAGTTSIEVRFTEKVTALGAPKAARVLQQTGLASLAESYAFVHGELPYDRFRDATVYLQDLLVERSAAIAQTEKLDAREVRKLLAEGSAVVRVLAIGLMIGDPSLADGPSIVASIEDSRSGNEQYHALRLAQRCWPRLSRQYRQEVRDTIGDAIARGSIPPDSDRHRLADEVLARPVG